MFLDISPMVNYKAMRTMGRAGGSKFPKGTWRLIMVEWIRFAGETHLFPVHLLQLWAHNHPSTTLLLYAKRL